MQQPTQIIGFRTNLTPQTGQGFGDVFTVGTRSIVSRLTVTAGESLEADDLFELHAVLEYDKDAGTVTRSYAVKEVDPVSATSYGIPLGANQTQLEIVLRGTYAWKKIVTTTLLIGVETADGYERTL